MEGPITTHQLYRIIKLSAEVGATIALVKTGHLKPYLKKSEAFRLYGRNRVEHWINQGVIQVRKDGDDSAAFRLDRIELELLSKAILLTEII